MLERAFDSHCHLDDPRFDTDRAQVLQTAFAAGVDRWLIPGVSEEQWPRAVDVAQTVQRLGCGRALIAVGCHPYALDNQGEVQNIAPRFTAFRKRHPVVAIGETGLDAPLSKRGGPSLEIQTEWLRSHVEYARASALPLVLHVVGAHGRALEVLESEAHATTGGVVHAFSGSLEVARRYLALGFKLGIGSLLLRAGARRVCEVTQLCPLSELVIETDAPDMAPGGARNHPSAVVAVAARVAELRGLSLERVITETRATANALFAV